MNGPSYVDGEHRGVFIELWVLDAVGDDYPAALLLSQLLWWHQPSKTGEPRVRYERNGERWLVRADDEWLAETRLTVKQVRRVRSVLKKLDLIECRRVKRNGAPVSAWRPNYDRIRDVSEPIRPDPEVPSEGQFHGSDPQGAVPSDLAGAVPIEKTSEVRPKTSELPAVPADETSSDPVQREAHRLAVLAFEQPVKPIIRGDPRSAFPAVLGIFKTVLRAGRDAVALERAVIAGIDVWTTGGVCTSIAKTNGNGQRNPMAYMDDYPDERTIRKQLAEDAR